ncbi:hypothetical protein GPECTOR_1g840 [Gonium pectorale]|uniref:Mediator of RNA polymerase II transcription subunit 14 n=1 Tax=Gonium pectorale TaxID=33097 RepID=A0A150H4F1_GONPE|nr:hypothetical protein GPECTOR_1g840 [Gonium pectorale]|eukprot:KXZ56932.1 hypothetical protein GPECTOR_1g840 [Gonium pectorale]
MAQPAQNTLKGAQAMVDLQQLLGDVFDNVLSDFVQLSSQPAPGPADPEQRKQRLLAHLHGTRQQLLRALVLLNWKPWKVLAELVDHERVADIAAAHVRTMHEVVGQMRQQAVQRIMAGSYLNMFDVNTALEVLTTGTYQELPSIILHRPPLFQPPPASLARQKARLAHVTHLIRTRLVQVALPPGLKVVSVSNGTAVLRAEGLYEAKLTLVPSEALPGADEDAAGGSGPAAAAAPDADGPSWAAAAAAAAGTDPVAAAAAAQRWKWRLIHFVLCIGVPFYDPRQPGQILNTCNFHMVLAADNAAYLARQRRCAGAAAGPGAGAGAPSESAATPAPSGLTGTGGAAGAGPGGGGSLAAAVKRSEDDEVGAPLAVMHAILTDVAGRLLADELAAAARALAAPGSRWHGHIAVKPSSLLSPGVRIEYWVSAPPLLAQRALPTSGTSGEDFRAVKPGPPYLELGMSEGGCVEVLHSPSSLHKPVAVSKLRLDTFRVNVEEVLMRAANMSSQFQLLQIRAELKAHLLEAMGNRAGTLRLNNLARQLWCREGQALQQPGAEEQEEEQARQQPQPGDGGAAGPSGPEAMDVDGGAAAQKPVQPQQAPIPPPTTPVPEVSGLIARAAPPEEAAGALVLLNAPVLEYLVAGTTELKIGKHLFSGRLTLRPGQDERDEGSLDHAATIAAHEDHINAAAMAAYNAASAGGDAYPAWRALREACTALSHVLQRTHTSTDATHFIQAARRASLHVCRLPRGLLESFTAACPSLAIEPRPREKSATWALQSVPFPPNFPPLEAVPPETPPLRVPHCLAFFLQSRLSLNSPHVLVAVSCNKQLMPIKVLSCIPVPPSTYRLPEQLVAACMAVSSSGHNHSHAAGGALGGAAAGGGTAAQGRSSPRAFANGHDAGGRSPDASPIREASGAGAGRLSAAGTGVSGLASSDAVAGPGGSGSGCGAAPSGIPSLPSGTSPQQQANGRPSSFGGGGALPQQPAQAQSLAHPHHGHSRPTGQQVAVMLAQQQLSSVVRWCRRRMVWEVLLVQLQAVGAAFEELCFVGPAPPPTHGSHNGPSRAAGQGASAPGPGRLKVTCIAGTQLPCQLARRRGLTPARVGPTCLELELGPDALAGQVTARLYGRFLCATACAPVGTAGAGAAAGFVLEPSRGGGPSGDVCLRRQYCLERGDSALTLVQDVAAIIRMQTLLARLEMTVPAAGGLAGASRGAGGPLRRPQLKPQLEVLAQASMPAQAGGHAAQQLQGNQAGMGPEEQAAPGSHPPLVKPEAAAPGLPNGRPSWAEADANGYVVLPSAKRIKVEPGEPDGTGPSAYGNGAAGSGGAAGYTWQRHGGMANGAVGNGHGGATSCLHAPGSTAAPTPSQTAGPSAGDGGGGGGGGAAAAGGLTWHWPLVGTLSSGEPFGRLFSDVVLCTVTCGSGHALPPEYLHVLEDFAEAGEEGKLLDAAAVAAWPLAGFCASLAPPLLARYGLSPELDVRPVLHQPPFCHRIVCRRRAPGGGSSSGPIMIDLWCQAVGRSYLKVSSPSPLHPAQQAQALGAGAEAAGPDGGATAGAAGAACQPTLVLQGVQRLAPERLGGRVHVAVGGRGAVHTGLGQRPVAAPGPGAPLWLLVPNDCVRQAVEVVYSALQNATNV